ncbi:MAG: reverse transcriptase domain-containing protein [Planctomycetota bacterium]
MTQSTIQFITKTRLAELSRQRESLLRQYDEAENAGNGSDLESLAKLHDGLKKVRITQIPLHRDLPNLQVLFHGGDAPASLIAFWRSKLELEIQRGRLRAIIVYLFGACLSEWDASDIQGAGRQEERTAETHRVLQKITSTGDPPSLDLLEASLSVFHPHHDRVDLIITTRLNKSLNLELSVCEGLQWIASNPHHPHKTRQEAIQIEENQSLLNQLEIAVRTANRDPRTWHWPDEGVLPRILWTRNRWRLYPSLPLVDLMSLHHTASFWSTSIEEAYTSTAAILNIRSRLQKLIDLNAPDVITSNERRMLDSHKSRALLDWYEPVDPWTKEPVLSEDEEKPVIGIVGIRASRQAELRSTFSMGYGYGEGVNPMVTLVHSEMKVLRAAFPDQPLHVLKIDVRDYFVSVPHETLLAMLRGLGMSEEGIDFSQRFLKTPYLVGSDEAKPAQTGVPMEVEYSHWLCEKLMQLLEQYVHSKRTVRIIRQLDDLCILSPSGESVLTAYETVVAFLADLGLSLNQDKSGAVTVGGDTPAGLPDSRPRWGVLELTETGQWQTSMAGFQSYLEVSQKEVRSRRAILAKVRAYNDQLRHLVWGIGLAMDLGDRHRESANATLQTFENEFYGSGVSIFDGLKSELQQRNMGEQAEIPLAWMLWPITAGGLGLHSTTVMIGQYEVAYEMRSKTRKQAPSTKTDDWQSAANEWSDFYDDMNVTLEPAGCDDSKRMKTFVEDFIRRGKSISGGKQNELSSYWRWVLSIFGPEILDQLGTFEFLLTDLVPLHLIHDNLLGSDAGDGLA